MRRIHLRLRVGLQPVQMGKQQESPEVLELVIGETFFQTRRSEEHEVKKGVRVGIVVKKCTIQSTWSMTRHVTCAQFLLTEVLRLSE